MRVAETIKYKGEVIEKVKDRALISGYAWRWKNKLGSLREIKSLIDEIQ